PHPAPLRPDRAAAAVRAQQRRLPAVRGAGDRAAPADPLAAPARVHAGADPRAAGPAWRRRRLAPARARAAPCTAARTDPETAAPLRPTGTDRGATARGGGGLRRGAHPIDRGNDDVREILHARAARAAREAREALGEERIREGEAEGAGWPRLMEEVRAEMEKGTDPSDPRVQALAQRWRALIEEFTGGDPGIAASLNRMYEQEDTIHGMDVAPMRAMGEYIGRALAAARERE